MLRSSAVRQVPGGRREMEERDGENGDKAIVVETQHNRRNRERGNEAKRERL
jgi:hypothetical protein